MAPKLCLDDLDHELMRRLSVNARISNRALGRAMNVSESVVRSRLRRLCKSGIIQFSAVTALRTGGRFALIYLWIDADEANLILPIAAALARRPQFHLVMTMIGRADILAVTATRTCGTWVDSLQGVLDGIEGIKDIRYSIAQRILKQAPIRCAFTQTGVDCMGLVC